MKRDESLAARIALAQERRRTASAEPRSGLWAQVVRVGSLGWQIALPIVGGAALGHLIDRWLGTGIAWSLTMLVLGLAVAAYTLWSELERRT